MDRNFEIRSVAGNPLMALSLRATDTIKRVKRHLQRAHAIPFFRQQLLIGSSVADDMQTLEGCPQHTIMTLVVLSYDASMSAALLAAASSGDVSGATLALKSRADPNCMDETGRTPLYCAAQMGHTQIVRLLCESCVDVDRPALGGVPTPLAVAAARGHLAIVILLVAAGADKDVILHERVTPLWLAARHGHLKTVKYLCRIGANINKPAPRGPTRSQSRVLDYHPGGSSPLWIATADKRYEVVKFLCGAGGDYKQPNQNGVTPAHVALRRGLASDWCSIVLCCYLVWLSVSFEMSRLGQLQHQYFPMVLGHHARARSEL